MKILEQYEGIAFIHPMKTAMTSIHKFIAKRIHKYVDKDFPAPHFNGHETPDEINWRGHYDCEWFRKSFCIMFVRNPYDRLVSFYHHMRQIGGHAEGICKRKTFDEFVREPQLARIVRPMSDYAYCEGEWILDYLGRYERLNEDIDGLIQAIGFEEHTDAIRAEWPTSERLMKTDHTHYMDYYDRESMGIVSSVFKRDFEMFGYGAA